MDESFPHSDWENPKSDWVPVKENHLSIQDTCVFWIKQCAGFVAEVV
jgi:hypothetical protein